MNLVKYFGRFKMSGSPGMVVYPWNPNIRKLEDEFEGKGSTAVSMGIFVKVNLTTNTPLYL